MNVILYRCNSENIVVSKSLDFVKSVDGYIKYDTDLMNPSINIETDDVNFNYCFIPDFGRYYYITDITYSGANGIIKTLSLEEDVLMSWKDYIRNSDGIIERNESQYNLYIPDNELVISSKPKKQVINFPNGFSGNKYVVLTVASGITQPTPETPAPATE